MAFLMKDRFFQNFFQRFNQIGGNRRFTFQVGVIRVTSHVFHAIVMLQCSLFVSLLLGFIWIHFFDTSFFSVEGRLPDGIEYLMFAVLSIVGLFMSLCDMRPIFNRFSRILEGHEGWLVSMVVVVLFEMIKKQDDCITSKIYSLFSFVSIGTVITLIALNYTVDYTGLTSGAIIASLKVVNGYVLQKEKNPSKIHWTLACFLLITSVFCKITEGRRGVPPANAANGDNSNNGTSPMLQGQRSIRTSPVLERQRSIRSRRSVEYQA